MKPIFSYLDSTTCDVVNKYIGENKKILHSLIVATSLDLST